MKIDYNEMVKKSKNPLWISNMRRKIVISAKNIGIKPTAREYGVSKNTVRKWVREYANGNVKLENKTTAPKKSPKKIEKYWEFEIITLCQKLKTLNKRFNACQIKSELKVPYSVKTVRKLMKQNGFAKSNKKKKERKRDMRKIKMKYKAFEKIQIDVKYLNDIPEFYDDYKKYKIPTYQYTARCVRTGALFFCYGQEKTVTNSVIFVKYVLNHLRKFGIRPKIIQTDNGTEFIQNWKIKSDSLFTSVVNRYDAKHYLIPPGAKTWQSDVETSHRLIEDEFYSYRIFNDEKDFYVKGASYQNNFNINRKNSYKNNTTPRDIMESIYPDISYKALILEPVVLDKLFDRLYYSCVA